MGVIIWLLRTRRYNVLTAIALSFCVVRRVLRKEPQYATLKIKQNIAFEIE